MANEIKMKSKVKLQGGAQLTAETAQRALVLDASGNIVSSVTTDTELSQLSGVTGNVQTQITGAQNDATQALSDAAAAQADATQALADAATAQSTINNHLADTVDAHDASAISVVAAGNLAATDVQAALVELQGDADSLDARLDAIEPDVADLITLSGVAANATTLGTFTGTLIPDSSTIKAAIQALETEIEAIPSPFYYAGTWAASTNTPTLADADVGAQGAVYYVIDSGSVDFGAGAISFAAGDKVANNGTTWDKWDMTDNVASVFGRTGAVTAQSGDYTATQVTNTPAGSIAATTVQAAIDELDSDIQGHITASSGAHASSAISYDNTVSGLTATTVKAALDELATAPAGSVGDIEETSASVANNQTSAANVTGLAFAAGVVRGFKVLLSVEIDATAALFETFELIGINKSGSFEMAQSSVGDESGIVLTITSAGQIQYTSANYAGFVSGAIKFRASTTTV